jgi:Ni,Fe-hydrogenase III small subunit
MLTLLRDLRRLRREIGLPRTRPGSLALRHVDAGSCNGCEHELTLATSPYVDLQRLGLGVVASPRHADVLLVTGAVTTRMLEPLRVAYAAMPEPRRVAALGDCALGCGVLGASEDLVGPVESVLRIDVRIPGCPPTPEEIAEALFALIDGSAAAGPAGSSPG